MSYGNTQYTNTDCHLIITIFGTNFIIIIIKIIIIINYRHLIIPQKTRQSSGYVDMFRTCS